MAINIPIITDFDGKGLDRAVREFKKLETTGEKAAFALKKAMVPAIAAVGALGGALGMATKAAMEDQAAQKQLAVTLRNTTGATDQQIASVEDQISVLSKASGVADDELRPAFEALTRGTKDISESTKQMTLVMDIARGTNRSMTDVADALAKAYQGNFRSLRQLTPEMANLIKEGASMDDILNVLGGTFGGLSDEFAKTAQGSLARLTVGFNEAKESIGAALLPVMEQLLPRLIRVAGWIEQNSALVIKLAVGVGSFAAAIVTANIALRTYETVMKLAAAANTMFGASTSASLGKIGLLVTAIAGTIAILNRLKQNSDSVSRGIVTAFDFVGVTLTNTAVMLARGIAQILNPVIDVMNMINPFSDIPNLPEPSYVQMPRRTFGGTGTTSTGPLQFPTPQGPPAPIRGVTTAIPAAGGGGGGGGGGGRITAAPSVSDRVIQNPLGIAAADFFSAGLDNPRVRQEITVNVNGGLGTSAEIGAAVVDSIRQYNQMNGPAPIAVAV